LALETERSMSFSARPAKRKTAQEFLLDATSAVPWRMWRRRRHLGDKEGPLFRPFKFPRTGAGA